MRANKLKQLACVLTGSLILTACNNNVGGTANTNGTTTVNVTSGVKMPSIRSKSAQLGE